MKSFNEILKESLMNKFVRYGDLDRNKKQKNYVGSNKSKDHPVTGDFHLAPVSRGFYAMPYDKEEPFLVGSLETTQPERFKQFNYNKDPFEMTEEENDAYNRSIDKHYKDQMNRNRKVFELKNQELIWHHLVDEVSINEIEQRRGSWILTTLKEYNKCRKKLYTIYDRQLDRDQLEIFVPSKSLNK